METYKGKASVKDWTFDISASTIEDLIREAVGEALNNSLDQMGDFFATRKGVKFILTFDEGRDDNPTWFVEWEALLSPGWLEWSDPEEMAACLEGLAAKIRSEG